MPTLDFKGKSFVYAHHLGVPFRELVLDKDKSLPAKGAKATLDDNLIIHGDNLLALKALLPRYAGKVDCIFIDPPYNTGNEGWCYNDNVRSPLMKAWLAKSANPVDKEDLERHDKWLAMMWPRLQLLRELLAEDGAIVVTLDDNEIHRFRTMMDEIFGPENFVASCLWQKNYSPKNTAEFFSTDHDYVMIYARSKRDLTIQSLSRTEAQEGRYKNPDNDPRGVWKTSDLSARNYYSEGEYSITTPGGRKIAGPPKGRYWTVSEAKFRQMDKDKRIWWGKDGNSIPQVKRFITEIEDGRVPQTIWFYSEVGHTDESKKELNQILSFETSGEVFITPKPVRLLMRVLQIFTKPDSIILDSFAGSGTTAHAVLAQNKKDGGNRRFILIECEDYADKLTAERVRRVIRGYPFKGTQRTELFREAVTWSRLKKAEELVQKAESIKQLEGAAYENVTIKMEDGELVVTGEKEVRDHADGQGGSFAYATLGPEMSLDALLKDGLPTFAALARYVFYTATGKTLEEAPKAKAAALGLVGETDLYRVHLHYQADKAWLSSNEAALTETMAIALAKANTGKKRLLVFAAGKFISQRDLNTLGIEYCQIPYAIHRLMGD